MGQTNKQALSKRAAVTSVISYLADLKDPKRKNGVAFFFGEIGGKMFQQIIDPPHPIKEFVFKFDRKFFLDPFFEMISAEETYGILVIDLAESAIGYLVGSKIRPLTTIKSQVPNKHHHGGMSSLRFERLRDDAINEYFKKVAEKCNEAFLNKGLKGLIIGGPAKTKNDFSSGDYLHHELRRLVMGTVDTVRTDRSGLSEAVEAAEGLLSTCQYIQEKRSLDRFWAEKGGQGLEVSGLAETTARLNNGQVQTLILSESLDLDTILRLKQAADRYDTEVLIVGEDGDFAREFNATIKVGGILRYK